MRPPTPPRDRQIRPRADVAKRRPGNSNDKPASAVKSLSGKRIGGGSSLLNSRLKRYVYCRARASLSSLTHHRACAKLAVVSAPDSKKAAAPLGFAHIKGLVPARLN